MNRVVELEFDRASDSQTLKQAQELLNTLRAEMASAQEHKEQIAAKCKEVIVCTSECPRAAYIDQKNSTSVFNK